MTCERTKKQRIKWLAARPGDIETFEDRRLVRNHPKLLRDRVEVQEPAWFCHSFPEEPVGECGVHLCSAPATHECDGCDIPICSAHTINRGVQWREFDTGFKSPGWRRAAVEDTFDLCPFCLFHPESQHKGDTDEH